MESSDEEDFSTHEWITPQSKINSIFQSHTEKGVRKLCCELLDLKDAVENLCGNMRTKYLAFLRISDEVVEMEHELIELQKHTSAQGIIVQDLMSAVSRELEEWARADPDTHEPEQDPQICGSQDHPSPNVTDHETLSFVDFDVLLAEHRVEEAIDALVADERSSNDPDFLKRKEILVDQLVEIAEQPLVTLVEFKKALVGLLKLGKGPRAHHLLLKSYGSHLQRSIEAFLPSCSLYPETYSATLAKFVFSAILSTTKESGSMFGDNPIYTNRLVQWAELEIELFVRLVKENGPMSETISALRGASICLEASLSHCSKLELQGLKLSKLLMVLLWPYIEEILEMNFRRVRRVMLEFSEFDDTLPLSPRFPSPLGFLTTSDGIFNDSGTRFMFIVKDLVDQLTPMAIFHFGGNILNRILQLFDKYVDALIKAMPSPSDDDHLAELKEAIIPFRAETDSQQLALLGTAFTVADELLPSAISRIWNESTEPRSGSTETKVSNNIIEFKEWRRNLQPSLDKLRDHFCRQYVLNFIYSREGKTRLDARIYLSREGDEDLFSDSDPLPSLPFQALFGKLQQLATVAGDVLLGREKIQKVLLARLTETVVIWLSDEQEFWGVFEDPSAPLHALGLQQLILDMHFIVEIARFGGYTSRHIHQIASAINARAVRTFAARGIDPQSALPEDGWLVETARAAINKLLLVVSGSDASETDDEHIVMHDEIASDSDDTPSSLSSVESSESFASANMGEIESPDDFED